MDDAKFILIARRSEDTAVATIYRLRFYPPRRLMSRKVVREEFDLDMPYIDRYMEKRMAYTDQQIEMLKRFLEGEKLPEIGEELNRITGGVGGEQQ
jgi:DNA-binding NarL/FixJ family response regulator